MKIFIGILGFVLFFCVFQPNKSQEDACLKRDSLRIDSMFNHKYHFQNDTVFRDTIRLIGYDIYLQTINRSEFAIKFKNIIKNGYCTQDSIFKENLNNYSYRVHDSILHIKLSTNNERIYTDSKSGIAEYAEYKYVGFLEKIKCHIVHFAGDESSCYTLLKTLRKDSVVYLMGNFCIDANWTRLITYDWDGFAFSSGNFKLYDIADGTFNELLSYSNDYERRGYFWFLNDFHFINNSEGIYIHEIQKHGSGSKEIKCYASMKIIKKASP